MKIRSQFYRSEFVSFLSFDALIINFDQADQFLVSEETGTLTPNGFSAKIRLPRQMDNNFATQSLVVASDFSSSGLQFLTLGNVFINMIAQHSLQNLWGTINSLQLVVIMPLHNITYPANAQVLFDGLLQVVTFDVVGELETFGIENKWEVSETDPYNDNFDTVGFGAVNLVDNLGSLNYVFGIMAIQVIVLLLMNWNCRRNRCNPIRSCK